MKKLLSLSLIFSLILALITPGLSLAHDLNQDELDEYLEYIEMTEEELETYLQERWGASLEYFYDVIELSDFIGPLLTEEDLIWLLDDFEITYEEFEQLVADAGLTMDYFIFYDDVYYFLLDNIEIPLFPEDYFDLRGYMSEFSLSEKETIMLMMHFFEVRENNLNLSADLNQLKDRGLSFRDGEFESIRELNAQEIAELFAIGEKAIELLDLHPEFYLDAAGKDKKAIDYKTLMSGEAIKGYDLLIELYNAEGTFLADFYITAEMFNSHFVKNILDDVDQIGKDVEEKINEQPTETEKKPPVHHESGKEEHQQNGGNADGTGTGSDNNTPDKLTKTVDGAKMPKTASDYPLYMMLGLGLMIVGAVVFRRVSREKKAA